MHECMYVFKCTMLYLSAYEYSVHTFEYVCMRIYESMYVNILYVCMNRYKRKMAKIAVDAVLSVADLDNKDVNFDMIKMEGKPGGRLEETELIHGIVIDKEFSHPQMPKEIKDAKMCMYM